VCSAIAGIEKKYIYIWMGIVMCGRYYIELDSDELMEIVFKAQRKAEQIEQKVADGEVRPSEMAAVIDEQGKVMPMRWGLKRFDNKGLIINARSETIKEKPMFRQLRRCVIPASGYYEWHQDSKEKFAFYLPDKAILYFAGLYEEPFGANEVARFVILTRQATPLLEPVHSRMPVILPQHCVRPWLYEDAAVFEEAIEEILYELVI
jgi:putative SOS response-associated peptidase YedK